MNPEILTTFEHELVSKGIVTDEQLMEAKKDCQKPEDIIYELLRKSLVDEEQCANFCAEYFQIPYVSLLQKVYDESIFSIIPGEICRNNNILPLFKVFDTLTVAIVNPLDYGLLEKIQKMTKLRINPVMTDCISLQEVVNTYYGAASTIQEIVKNVNEEDIKSAEFGKSLDQVFNIGPHSGPINNILHNIITHAIHENASDIHFEPSPNTLQIRYRIDGILYQTFSLPKYFINPVISAIKILAKMDIAEKRVPLDGSFEAKVVDRVLDIRVSSFPTSKGEKLALRLLDKETGIFNFEDIGFTTTTVQRLSGVINQSNGLLLVTGPTGSGKTTTLYSILNKIKSIEKNIVTIEDPIEYQLEIINQSQVNVKAGLTFARGLRSFLRQDPDIILVGEIRDNETAEIGFQAALTGHLVLSTLHTNDAPSAITRLIDMNIEPFLISSALSGVLAQRLVRRICPFCKKPMSETQHILDNIEMRALDHFKKMHGEQTMYKGEGCKHCKGTGYKGRIGIFELMIPNNEMRERIHHERLTDSSVREMAIKNGMVTLLEDGMSKVLAGLTTIEEVARVL
ncbi:GspE/PulE family protein [Candidatus Margulisiibacteriota bacterium]